MAPQAGPSNSWIHSPPAPQYSLPNSPHMASFGAHDQQTPQPASLAPSQVFNTQLRASAMEPGVGGPPPPGINPTLLQPATKPSTPPPLFSPDDHALFSSFLSSFASSSEQGFGGEPVGWEFNPQGMPPDMPVLEELKRRLEAENEGGISEGWVSKGEADAMGREVASRLRLDSGPQDGQTVEKELDGGTPGTGGRKKQRTTAQDVGTASSVDGDVEMSGVWVDESSDHTPMSRKSRRPSSRSAKRPSPPSIPVNPSAQTSPAQAQHSFAAPGMTMQSSQGSPSDTPTASGAPPRANHLLSEQKRRSAIQGGFGALVDLIRAGEPYSGISVGTSDTPAAPLPGVASADPSGGQAAKKIAKAGGKAPMKPPGRGRGRRGEIDTGASKSVVLERAVEYVKWMQTGNRALRAEVDRVEMLLRTQGVML